MSERQFFKLNADSALARHQQKRQVLRSSNSNNRISKFFQQEVSGAKEQRIRRASSNDAPKRLEQLDELNHGENLSFCGCGFLGIYHVGVASCFHEYAPQLATHKVSGSSAGALVAVAHICGNLQLAYIATDILRVALDARSRTLGPFHPSFDINSTVRKALERGLPGDVHKRVNGRLHISLTRVYDGQNVIVSNFDSKEDVIQALLCSCFIPFWSGIVAPKFKGVAYTDGGFSNNLIILDDKTVTVSPFAGEADICPQDNVYNLLSINVSNTSISVTPHNLYRLTNALLPPRPEVLNELCAQGFADGIKFLQRMKFISFDRCLEIKSSLVVTTEILEENVTEVIQQSNKRILYSSSIIQRRKDISLTRTTSCTSLLSVDEMPSEAITTTTVAGGGECENIVVDIERTTLYYNIPWYPFFYACASVALDYILDCVRSGALARQKHQGRVLKLVRYFSL